MGKKCVAWNRDANPDFVITDSWGSDSGDERGGVRAAVYFIADAGVICFAFSFFVIFFLLGGDCPNEVQNAADIKTS